MGASLRECSKNSLKYSLKPYQKKGVISYFISVIVMRMLICAAYSSYSYRIPVYWYCTILNARHTSILRYRLPPA